ncbi:MAG: hypothetical protein WD231_00895 [Candidatus Woykebacteria bacterium]
MELKSNPCVRCGKERIKGKEDTFMLNSVKTKTVVYTCPDKECQKIVDKQIAEKEERRLFFLSRGRGRPKTR